MKLKNNLYLYPEAGVLDCNTYFLRGSPGIIIDPGAPESLPALLRDMEKDGIRTGDIGLILNTHLHLDHCGADEICRKSTGARLAFHQTQQDFYPVTVIETTELFGFPTPATITPDSCFNGDYPDNGEVKLETIPSPGHSPDSVCYYWPGARALICGDVIFDHNTGRADLPGGKASALRASIGRLAQLEIECLLPGHMGVVMGANEVRRNFDYVRDNVLEWL